MVEVDGHVTKVHGAVLLMLADTLAAHQLGGFKVGVGFALRKCRSCMATWDDMQTKVYNPCIPFIYRILLFNPSCWHTSVMPYS